MRVIRYAFLVAALSQFAGSVGAQTWAMTVKDNKLTAAVDTSRVKVVGDGIYQVFAQWSFESAQYWNADRKKPYHRGIDQSELNCRDLSFRSISQFAYDKRGNVVGTQQTPNSAWASAVPGSYAEGHIRNFCSYAMPRFVQSASSSVRSAVTIDPRWLVIGGNTMFTLRADTSRLARVDSGYVRMFERGDYGSPQRTVTLPVTEYSYTVGDAFYDCRLQRKRYVSVTGYTASGGIAFSEKGSPDWIIANPQSINEHAIRTVCALPMLAQPARAEVIAASEPAAPRIASTGSAFPVSRSGVLLTNAHVVNSCDQLRVRLGSGRIFPARVIVVDDMNDLAVIRVDATLAGELLLRSGRPIRPGDDVVAIGFPLAGLLADQPIVTTGTVSALAGIGNDSRYLQITSPVQPGNSGGPLLDLSGHLIGVVSARLNDSLTNKMYGGLPQNVNFALNASVMKNFLDAHSIRYGEARSDSVFSKGQIGSRGRGLTYRVDCWTSN